MADNEQAPPADGPAPDQFYKIRVVENAIRHSCQLLYKSDGDTSIDECSDVRLTGKGGNSAIKCFNKDKKKRFHVKKYM